MKRADGYGGIGRLGLRDAGRAQALSLLIGSSMMGLRLLQERMMKKDHHIAASVIFGRGRFQAGILVEPKAEFAFEPADEVLLAEFRNKIWCAVQVVSSLAFTSLNTSCRPTVQRLNAYAPQHSRLFKEVSKMLHLSPNIVRILMTG